MLETPKSAKTPSTGGIPNSCATSAILENRDCTSFTFSPKLFSRSRANSSACASRSRLIKRPDVSLFAIAGSGRALGSDCKEANVRTLDQPGPGRTGAGVGAGAAEELLREGGAGAIAVREDCGGRARVGDSAGGRGLGRLGSFEHAA